MGSYLYHRYATDGSVSAADVRSALNELTDDDLSVSSPVSAGVDEAGTGVETVGGGVFVTVTVDGHDGDWTKTSEQAIKSAVESVEGVHELAESEGGYDG